MGLGSLFGKSSRASRRTTKKVGKGVRVNVNRKSVSVRLGGENASLTVGRRGVTPKVTILGLRVI